jgi:proline iminopeptidase
MSTATSSTIEGAVAAAGTSLSYVAVGDGPPVIVVHGGPGLGHSYLRPGMDRLADRFRVIYYDQRGTGRSEIGDRTRMNLAGVIADLDAVREGLGLEEASILGHSFGANLALLYAARHPGRVASLVLANPGPPFDQAHMQAFGAEMARRRTAEDQQTIDRIEGSEPFQRRDPAAFEELYRIRYLPFLRDPASAAKIEFRFTRITAENLPGAPSLVPEFADFDPAGSASRIEAPTLVVHGELDAIPAAFSTWLAETIPSARYELLPGVSHFAFLEDPEPFFAAVTPFLAARTR